MSASEDGAMRRERADALETRARTLTEEFTSAAIQGSAAASVVGLAYLVLRAWPRQSALHLVAVLVYGTSMILAFLASALYHGSRHARRKPIFRALDHCMIFFFIAGTYTPVTILALWLHAGWELLATTWAIAITGAVLRILRGPRFHRIALPLYLAMGWLVLAWSGALYEAVGLVPVLLFAAGGLAYTGGLLFYRWERLPFNNPLWHLCVVIGSGCFFIAIAFYLLPQASLA